MDQKLVSKRNMHRPISGWHQDIQEEVKAGLDLALLMPPGVVGLTKAMLQESGGGSSIQDHSLL